MGAIKEPEVELYVVNRSPTESEEKEFSLFIRNKKRKENLLKKYKKPKKGSSADRNLSIASEPVAVYKKKKKRKS